MAIRIPLVSVHDLFQAFNVPAVIDYLSLDIEGGERYCFQDFPWDRYVFLAITVERPKGLESILLAHGYVFIKDHGDFGDKLYIHRTHPRFAAVAKQYGVTV